MIHSREPMSVEQLSKIIRDYEEPFYREVQLIGSIITCPLCGNRAVIVPLGMSLEKNLPCHCIMGQYSSNIYEQYCARSKSLIDLGLDLADEAGWGFAKLNSLDIPDRFKWFTENGYIF